MTNDWIIDVLADLRSFSRKNGLPGLAEQLDDTILLAAAEIGRNRAEGRTAGHEGKARESAYRASAGHNPL